MSRYDKHNPFSFCAYGVSCRARAERVRYAGNFRRFAPRSRGRLQWFPRSPAPWQPETRLGFYVRAAAYNTRATNVTLGVDLFAATL